MFKELAPVLRDRAVLMTVTLVDADQIRVNIVPKKLKDSDNDALTTPLSVTGTAEDLDAELSSTIVGFVGSHLQMKNTLEMAKAEMDAASKAAQAEARAKSKTTGKKVPPKTEVHTACRKREACRASETGAAKNRKPLRFACTGGHPIAAPAESEEDSKPFVEIDDDEPAEEAEELDDAA